MSAAEYIGNTHAVCMTAIKNNLRTRNGHEHFGEAQNKSSMQKEIQKLGICNVE